MPPLATPLTWQQPRAAVVEELVYGNPERLCYGLGSQVEFRMLCSIVMPTTAESFFAGCVRGWAAKWNLECLGLLSWPPQPSHYLFVGLWCHRVHSPVPTCDCVSMPVWCPIRNSVSASSGGGWGQWRISHCLQRLLCLHQYACMHSCLSVSAFLCQTKQCVVEKHVLLVLGGNHFSQGLFAARCWCTVHSLCVLLRQVF